MNTCAVLGGDGGAGVGAGACASSGGGCGDGVDGCSDIVVGIGGGDVHESYRHPEPRLSESEEGLVVAAPRVAEVVPVVPVVRGLHSSTFQLNLSRF